MSKLKSKFSSVIFHSRIKYGYTQSQVAEAVSISIRWYQKIERGERLPSTEIFIRLVLFLNIDLNELRDAVEVFEPIFTR